MIVPYTTLALIVLVLTSFCLAGFHIIYVLGYIIVLNIYFFREELLNTLPVQDFYRHHPQCNPTMILMDRQSVKGPIVVYQKTLNSYNN